MTSYDEDTGQLCLTIVYDGAPQSGKTASLHALGRHLGRPVITPDERDGRTLYFDWLDYSGGTFQGKPIDCRVISVPGQADLAARRELILRGADALIFVADTTAGAFPASLRRLADLEARLRKRTRQIPVVVQLNKRDAEDALPRDELAAALGSQLTQVESVAIEGEGVRVAFARLVGEVIRAIQHPPKESDLYDTQEIDIPDPEKLREILQHA